MEQKLIKINVKFARKNNNNYIKKFLKQNLSNQNLKIGTHSVHFNKLCQLAYKFQNTVLNKYFNVIKMISSDCEKKLFNTLWNDRTHIFVWIHSINFNLVLNIIKNHFDKNAKSLFKKFSKYSYFNCFTDPKYFQIISNFYFHYFGLYLQNNILRKVKYKKRMGVKNVEMKYNILVLQNIWNKTKQDESNIKYDLIQFNHKIWLRIILNFKQDRIMQTKIKHFFLKRLFLIYKTIKIYTNYNWNELFFNKKYNLSRKTKNQNYAMLKNFIEILFLHAIAKKYARLKKNGKPIKATVNKTLVTFDDTVIIRHFRNIINKIIRYHLKYILYYSVRFLIFVFRKACALTLSYKYQTKTSAAGFKKFENFI